MSTMTCRWAGAHRQLLFSGGTKREYGIGLMLLISSREPCHRYLEFSDELEPQGTRPVYDETWTPDDFACNRSVVR